VVVSKIDVHIKVAPNEVFRDVVRGFLLTSRVLPPHFVLDTPKLIRQSIGEKGELDDACKLAIMHISRIKECATLCLRTMHFCCIDSRVVWSIGYGPYGPTFQNTAILGPIFSFQYTK